MNEKKISSLKNNHLKYSISLFILLVSLFILNQSGVNAASTNYAKVDGTEYSKLQDAIDNAESGDTIYISGVVNSDQVKLTKSLTFTTVNNTNGRIQYKDLDGDSTNLSTIPQYYDNYLIGVEHTNTSSITITFKGNGTGRLTLDANYAEVNIPTNKDKNNSYAMGNIIQVANKVTCNLQSGVQLIDCRNTGNTISAGAKVLSGGTLVLDGATIKDCFRGVTIVEGGNFAMPSGTISAEHRGIYSHSGMLIGGTNISITGVTGAIALDGSNATCTINGGTYKATGTEKNGIELTNGASLSFVSGTISGCTKHGISASDSNVTISGGTISSNGFSGIRKAGTGTLTITGGTFSSNSSHGISVGGGTCNISGATAKSNGEYGVNVNGGTVTITSGTYDSNSLVGARVSSGTLTISGGTYKSNSYNGAENNNGTLKISGGTYSGNTYYGVKTMNGTTTISNGAFDSNSSGGMQCTGGTTTVTGGTFNSNKYTGVNMSGGTLGISGGTFNSNPTAGLNLTGGTATLSGGTYKSNGYAVNYSGGYFYIKGGLVIDSSNSIYLAKDKFIEITGALTANWVANIVSGNCVNNTVVAKTTYTNGKASAVLSKFGLPNNGGYVLRAGDACQNKERAATELFISHPYTVTYKQQNGQADFTKTVYYNEPADLTPTAQKKDMIFIGWSAGTGANNAVLMSLNITANTTLYARYSTITSQIKKVAIVVKNKSTGAVLEKDVTNKAIEYATAKGVFNYDIVNENISGVGTDKSNLSIWLHIEDYAGNDFQVSIHDKPDPIEQYLVTVNYYKQSGKDTLEYIHVESYTETIEKNKTFVVNNIPPQTGTMYGYSFVKKVFDNESIVPDGGFKVTADTIVNVYYDANEYTLTFDANSGEIVDKNGNKSTTSTKKVIYTGKYGVMPTPEREGYNFKGWYTQKGSTTGTVAGEEKFPEDTYNIVGNSTLYAKWEVINYNLTLNYQYHGGTHQDVTISVPYGTYPVYEDLPTTVKGSPDGYAFVGWAYEKMSTNTISEIADKTFKMPAKDITIYAVYKRTITMHFMSSPENKVGEIECDFYNLDTDKVITTPEIPEYTSWEIVGWSKNDNLNHLTDAESNGDYTVLNTDSENIYMYAIYRKGIEVSYRLNNDGAQEFEPHTDIIYYNAKEGKTTSMEVSPLRPLDIFNYSFVNYNGSDGKKYEAGQTYNFTESVVLDAIWDEYPSITCADRYFTLQEAQEGYITYDELLRDVEGSDREDGITEVFLVNYQSSDFTNLTYDSVISIRYITTDSFCNSVTEDILVTIIDSSVKEPDYTKISRAFGNNYYQVSTMDNYNELSEVEKNIFDADADGYIDEEMGGLLTNSIWKTIPEYNESINDAVNNKKTEIETQDVYVLTLKAKVTKNNTGKWTKTVRSHTFSSEKIREIKDFLYAEETGKGIGKFKFPEALSEFISVFMQ